MTTVFRIIFLSASATLFALIPFTLSAQEIIPKVVFESAVRVHNSYSPLRCCARQGLFANANEREGTCLWRIEGAGYAIRHKVLSAIPIVGGTLSHTPFLVPLWETECELPSPTPNLD